MGLFYLRGFEAMSAMIRMIIEVIRDASPFFVIIAIAIVGLSHAYRTQPGWNVADGDPFPWRTVYQYFVGGDGLESDSGNTSTMAVVIWFLSSKLGSVVMLNLLIAIMADTYERVQEKADVMRFREVAGILLEVEGFIPHAWLRRANTGYIFVARPLVSPEEKEKGEQWKGFAGEIRNEVRNVAGQLETIAAKQMRMEETIAALAAQQKHISATLERLLEVNSKTALPEGSRD